jgi:hypothetical protein
MDVFTMIGTNEVLPKIKIVGIGRAGINIIQQIAKADSPFGYILMDSNPSVSMIIKLEVQFTWKNH